MKRSVLPLALVFLVTFLVGCATFNQNVFKAESAAATLADTGMKVWAEYYNAAFYSPADFGTDHTKLAAQRVNVDQLSVKVGTSIHTLDKVRESYAAGTATKTSLQSALAAVQNNADALTETIRTFLPAPYKEKVK
jgi:hypothetical protein